jgi:hypothetical protein
MKKTAKPLAKPPSVPTTWLDIINEARLSNRYSDLPTILQKAVDRGISVTWGMLHQAGDFRRGGAIVTPSFIADFVAAYAAELKPKSILDAWAGIGSILIPVVTIAKVPTATGITQVTKELDVARLMSGDAKINWVNARPTDVLPTVGEFDIVVSSPPWGMQAETLTITEGGHTFEVRDSKTYTLMMESARHLSNKGVGVFLLPNGFFFLQGKALVRDALAKVGLHVNSVVALPVGAFAPFTGLPLNIVLISRTKTTELFVCQLVPGADHKAVLKNLLRRQPGASLELGRLVPMDTFTSFRALQAIEEEQRLAQRTGLKAVALADVVTAINLGKQTDDGGFENVPNSVYLPLIGTSLAVTALSDLRIKPQNYAQLIVRPEVANAEFLAGFFNSPLGRKTRDSMLSGTFIPKLSKQSLSQGKAYLIPMEAQQDAMVAGRELRDLRLRLEQLERDLWNRPIDAGKVRKTITSFNQREGFESWLETLPFPLASILWRYQAAGVEDHKSTHLFNFFEAVAQYLGTLMTSAFHSNPEFFREHRHDWFEPGKDNAHSLSRSSFGEWVVRCQRLAKTTRQLLSDKEQRAQVLDLYRTDAEKIDSVANKGIYAVLETVGRYRNEWKGHSGIVSTKEHKRRLALLQEELTRLRGSLGGVFEDWWLVRPSTSSYRAGVFEYSSEKLMGSRQVFIQETLTTTEVMDANELYCYDNVTRRPLQLLHFVRMLAAPDTEEIACYFFNRIDKNGMRWVSYHFEKEAERHLADAAMVKIISDVEEDTGKAPSPES